MYNLDFWIKIPSEGKITFSPYILSLSWNTENWLSIILRKEVVAEEKNFPHYPNKEKLGDFLIDQSPGLCLAFYDFFGGWEWK